MENLINDLDITNNVNNDLSEDLELDTDILDSNEIDNLLSNISDEVEANKFKPRKMGPFKLTLDFKYKNFISNFDTNSIRNLIYNTMNNYIRKIKEIKSFNDLSIADTSKSFIKTSEIEYYFNFENLTLDNIDSTPIIKEYLLNNNPIYIAVSTGLVNFVIDRNLKKSKDKITEYAAELYFFSLFKSYFNQLSSKQLTTLAEQNPTKNIKNLKDELCLLINVYLRTGEELIPISIVLPKETCINFIGKPEKEITIHSNDYYKKRGAFAVISGTKLEDSFISTINEGTVLTFPIKENKYIDLVINNSLIAKGICGTYSNPEFCSKLEIKEIMENKSDNYFTTNNNTFLIFATADKNTVHQQLANYTKDTNTQIELDTEINISTLLLVINSKIIGTAEVTEKDNNLQAKVKKILKNQIEII